MIDTTSIVKIGKIAVPTVASQAMSFSHFESWLRISSLIISIVLSILVYMRDTKRKKSDEKTNQKHN